ncbi:PilW family protein [Tepidimonas sp.]|uniref:PilW family protein n=1 Tax=Tepidimonas sp. TaxID=2002775 RepID=UPI002FE20417
MNGQRGLSLIELMVAITIGLIIVLGAAMMILPINQTTTSTTRASRMNTDARAMLDLFTNELQRAGYQSPAADNPYIRIQEDGNCIVYGYAENPGSAVLWHAFRFNANTRQMQAVYNRGTPPAACSAAGLPWMSLTESNALPLRSDGFSAQCPSPGNILRIQLRFEPQDGNSLPDQTLEIQPRNTTCTAS